MMRTIRIFSLNNFPIILQSGIIYYSVVHYYIPRLILLLLEIDTFRPPSSNSARPSAPGDYRSEQYLFSIV